MKVIMYLTVETKKSNDLFSYKKILIYFSSKQCFVSAMVDIFVNKSV